MGRQQRMPLLAALEAVAELRRDQIVVATMGAAREWPKLSQHPLDFHYLPSAMGHAPMIALGLALAQPQREVIVFNGDGCMLMGLGGLVTIAASGATNLTLIVLDNGLYEVTGGQTTAGAIAGVDFARMARAAGFASAASFDDLPTWRQQAAAALAAPGPRFISLAVEPVGAEYLLPPPAMHEQIERFCKALAAK
ncbi:MAG TPA: thiamine pyrophosphate-dependent enzyme [Pirellulales bacterium]|nr:thiamine pyrophosphate-dependent enzyme [Pirellulales bacterium]